MFLALLISYLAKHTFVALGAPTTASLISPSSIITNGTSTVIIPSCQTQTPSSLSLTNHRSIEDIIWSCIGTMVACSWVSVHPNMHGFNEHKMSMHLRHLAYMFWAIVVPEAMIFWAMRQWHGARELEKQFKAKGWTSWTITHGHFLQMGGFVLVGKHGQKIRVINPEEMLILVEKGRIEPPKIPRSQIDELSTTSVLARTLVVIQILWFSLQCIARHIEGLPITKLELATAALATVNLAMYICWVDKPFGPVKTIGIEVKTKEGDEPEIETDGKWTYVRKNTLLSPRDENFEYTFSWTLPHIIFIQWPKRAFLSIHTNLGSLSGRWKPHVYEDRVSSYYSYPIADVKVRYFTNFCACLVGLVFAGIHCAGWNFTFPTRQERIIWRVCCITIFSVPLAIFCSSGSMKLYRYYNSIPKSERTRRTLALRVLFFIPAAVGWITMVVLIPMYILGRLGLLVEAFFSLRQLEPGTLDLVKWSTFIPHV